MRDETAVKSFFKKEKNVSIELMRYLMIISVAILHFGEDFTGEKRTLRGGRWE